MSVVTSMKIVTRKSNISVWLPLLVMPILAGVFANQFPAWVFMWLLSFSIYFGLKWLTFAEYAATNAVTFGRSVGYLLLWAGMDAPAFFSNANRIATPKRIELAIGIANLSFGLLLILAAITSVEPFPVVGSWMGMAGIVFVIHFGLVRLISFAWRHAGVNAQPIMNAPILSISLSDFWGKRWNLAFRDLAHTFVFRPLVGRLGITGATLAVFLTSGIIHDVVISTPARGGLGLPTLYFLIQGCAILFERSKFGKHIKLGNGALARIYCHLVLILPMGLLFHQPFINVVVVPMLKAIGNIGVVL
jgi:Membrane bound O-acyl transferase family